jgi:carbon monoxide dehydrogenase subunit G
MALTLQETYPIGQPAALLWERVTDVHFVADCFPGASLQGQRDDGRHEGVITMQLGPTRVRFEGSVAIEYDDAGRTATLQAKGGDTRRTRASADATVRVEAVAGDTALLHVDAVVDVVGPLSQFARTGGVEVTRTLLHDFAAAVETALTPAGAGAPARAAPPPTSELSLLRVLLRSLEAKLRRGWGRLRGDRRAPVKVEHS